MFKRIYSYLVLGIGFIMPAIVFASNEPLDLASTGSTLAGYVAGAAGAALGVLAAIWGVRVIIRAFRAAIGR